MEKKYTIRKSVFLFERSLKGLLYFFAAGVWGVVVLLVLSHAHLRGELVKFALFSTFTLGMCWYLVHLVFNDLRKTEFILLPDRLFKFSPTKNIELPYSQISGFKYNHAGFLAWGTISILPKHSFRIPLFIDRCADLLQSLMENPATRAHFSGSEGLSFKNRIVIADYNARQTVKTFPWCLYFLAGNFVASMGTALYIWNISIAHTFQWVLSTSGLILALYAGMRLLIFLKAQSTLTRGTAALETMNVNPLYFSCMAAYLVIYLAGGTAYHQLLQ